MKIPWKEEEQQQKFSPLQVVKQETSHQEEPEGAIQ